MSWSTETHTLDLELSEQGSSCLWSAMASWPWPKTCSQHTWVVEPWLETLGSHLDKPKYGVAKVGMISEMVGLWVCLCPVMVMLIPIWKQIKGKRTWTNLIWWLERATFTPCMLGRWMKKAGWTCTYVTWDAKVACFDGAVVTDSLVMLLNFPLMTTKKKIFLSKHFMLHIPLAMAFNCVNNLKDMLIGVRLAMETLNKSAKCLVGARFSLKHDGGCIGSTI